jgi:translation initiation factor IF-2
VSEEPKKKIFIKKSSKAPIKIKLKNPSQEEGQPRSSQNTQRDTHFSSDQTRPKHPFNNKRPGGSSGGYQGRDSNRPAGAGGSSGGYQGRDSNRPAGAGGSSGGYQGRDSNRPAGAGGSSGGYQGRNSNRPAGAGGYQNRDQRPGFKKEGFDNKRPGGASFNGKPVQKGANIPDAASKKDFYQGSHKRTGKTDFNKRKKEFSKEEQAEINFELQRKKTMGYAVIPQQIEINETILVSELAQKMNLKVGKLLQKLMELGYMATINDALDSDIAEIVASEFNCHVVVKSRYEELGKLLEALDDKAVELEERPPIVTIMGHVDHGKTTLLDYIRKSHVTKDEAGGITQYVGAYQIEYNNKKITFIDTPGHEAFSQMRSRGALITDIVILVVAADDGVMPQTIEALNHAKAAHVPIIVAVNKIDKDAKNIESIKSILSEQGLVPEEWGGETLYIGTSALTGEGVNNLLETILLIAEMKEYKAGKNKPGKGIILESKIDKSRGSGATVIVKDGTFSKGDIVLVGTSVSRIRAMFDHNGMEITQAFPSTPFEILGFEEIPEAGDMIHVTKTEKIAREIIEKRKEIRQIEHAKKIKKVDTSLDVLYSRIQEQNKVDFNIIVKADVQGTAEAIKGMIENLASKIEEVNLRVIHSAVGAITESDIILASTSKAIIIGFNVRVNNDKANALAKEKGVEIRRYSIIYEIGNDLKDAIEGILEPEKKENIIGEAQVRKVFKISKLGTIAGVNVTGGVVKINSIVRVIREGIVIFTGKIVTLKRFKDDIKEATKGSECGIAIQNYQDIKEGDVFEIVEIVTVSRKLTLKD